MDGISLSKRLSLGQDQGNATREMARQEYAYTIEFRPAALKVLESLPKDMRRQIGFAVDRLQRDFTGDLKKLKGYKFEYRLRVGGGILSCSL